MLIISGHEFIPSLPQTTEDQNVYKIIILPYVLYVFETWLLAKGDLDCNMKMNLRGLGGISDEKRWM
jgi:hypothetical protein